MPLRAAIPPSEMNPTRLATVSVCPLRTSASTPPMKAVGTAVRIWATIRPDGNSMYSTKNMPTTDTADRAVMSRVASFWLWNCPPYSIVYPSGSGTSAATTRSMSPTTEARSRPRALHRITIRRRASSRFTWLAPASPPVGGVMSARSFSRTCSRPPGRSNRSSPRFATSARYGSSSRTSRSTRRCPSTTCDTTSPFSATCTKFPTAARSTP